LDSVVEEKAAERVMGERATEKGRREVHTLGELSSSGGLGEVERRESIGGENGKRGRTKLEPGRVTGEEGFLVE